MWSPDGTDIAFTSSRVGGRLSLFHRSASGSGEDNPLMKSAGTISGPDWSPDRVLIYAEDGDLWTLPVSAGKKEPFLKTRFVEVGGEFSPDGRWVAYESDESGRKEVYVRPFPRQEGSFPISRDGGRAPRWRGDGKELFFLTLDGTLMATGIDSRKSFNATVPQPLFETGLISTANFHPYVVTRDGQRFLIPVILNPEGAAPITVVLNWAAKLPH